jgi:subtilisin family serine protease
MRLPAPLLALALLAAAARAERFLVTLRPEVSIGSVSGLVVGDGVVVEMISPNVALVQAPADVRAGLSRDPSVLAIEDDADVHLDPVIEATAEAGAAIDAAAVAAVGSWGLDRIDGLVDGRFTRSGYTGAGVSLYIIDTGVYAGHREFTGRVARGMDFTVSPAGRGDRDCNGHGTHTASTAGGDTLGVARKAAIVPVKVLGCSGSGSTSGVIRGIQWAAAQKGRKVLSMSLGGARSAALNAATAAAVQAGAVVTVAAGNSNNDACLYSPASELSALTVAATDEPKGGADRRAGYSCWGACVDLFAPGSNIVGAAPGSPTATATKTGTSMATPHVAGVAATVLQQFPLHTPAQVQQVLAQWAARGAVQDPRGTPNLFLLNRQLAASPAPSAAPSPAPTRRPSRAPTPRPTQPCFTRKARAFCETPHEPPCAWFRAGYGCRNANFCRFRSRATCALNDRCAWARRKCGAAP